MGTNITGIGNANAIGFKSRVTGGIYFPPELKDALVGVWSAYGKSNDSTDRNIIKNKIKDKGGDFVISNAAYKLNSGYGKYEEDFTDWKIYPNIKVTDNVITTNGNFNSTWFIYKHSSESKINEMNIKVSGIPKGGKILYFYISDETDNLPIKYTIPKDGIYHLPESKINNNRVSVGFTVESRYDWNNIRIEQIPSFEGAFVTDGKDDFITSTKTVQEMLGGSNEITVVSMIHLVQTPAASSEKAYTNQIRTGQNYLRNYVTDNGKTGIYGYTCKGNNVSVINNILGDKNDYTVENKSWNNLAKFSVIGYEDNGTINELDQVAWYWTIIANKVLTIDQINQVIAYFNLDRTLKPDILCDVKKQGITNENHAEFGDKLIDFSGNGRDIQLNNLAWDGDSGIGKYNYPNWKVTATIANTYSTIVNYPTVNGTYSINVNGVSELMQSIGLHLEIKYTTSTGIIYNDIKQDGVYSYILPDGATDLTLRFGGIPGIVNEPCNITITQIPSHAGALCLDGVNDFGKVTGMPVYKDYTVVTDREIFANIGAILSKNNPGAFVETAGNSVYSFGQATSGLKFISTRSISYLSKYSYCGQSIAAGAAEDVPDMWLGTIRDGDSRFFNGAIYSLMSFPYSMSEFLIERQLKKHKLGTLYPDMVEFRPIIKANDNYKIFYTAMLPLTGDIWERINIGDYVPVGRRIAIQMSFDNEAKKLVSAVSSQLGNITIVKNSNNIGYTIFGDVLKDKSPQKISITIEQDENYVLFNPVINSNYKYISLDFFLNNYQKKINIGDYIPKDAYLRANLYLNNNVDEPAEFTFNGVSIGYSRSITVDTAFNIEYIYNYDSPQKVNITIDEYIRYEDIVQPYPVLLRFNDESGKEVSWGGKFRVGSTITRIGSAADSNLLPNIYNIFGLLLNDNQVTSSKVIVEKTMVFKAKSAYIFDNNEPNCILSPRLLRIPNSSYKILGYIPDISGHGNHGVIHNSAYAEGSGVNEDGSYQFDGVDDFVTIPTTVGGKQVLMKVNWDSPNASILYDQRGYNNNEFAIYNGTNDSDGNPIPAYQGRNNGQTYIDGILNSNIKASELRAITHNITITNELSSGANKTYPIIGSSKSNAYFVNMALYDFMLFDEISTDDKIKELNEYIGLSGNIFEFNPPTFTIDLPMAIKNIKVYQGGNEISPGYLYPNKDTEFEVYVSLNDGKYAVDTITVDDVEITKDRVVGEYNIFKFTLNGSSEQKITIHSYEYIMYEDIIQPYPSFVKLENLDRTHTYTWGDKLRIGDTIRYNSSKNLLEGAYTLRGQLECNGVYVFDNNQQIVVTKEMVFAWSHSPVWTIGNSAPKCVFSPSKLRIPNSSYKYLGYIPDISGNGNHGVFNNFAFSKMSGADGYPYDYKSTSDFVAHAINAVLVNSETVKFINVLTQTSFYYKGTSYKGKIKVTGITKAIASGKVRYLDIYSNSPTNNDRVIIDKDGIYDVNIETEDAINIFFYLTPIVSGTTALDEPVYLEQVGNYEGSICFDGVDDYMDIPSLSIGGKQVLMKTNWLKSPTLLYDQRASGSFAILTTKEDDATNPRIAYQARNQDGKTYIDGIENNYIETYSLKGITHNITVTNPSAGSGVVPVIGANTGKSSGFAKMALYDFMLFDEVSTNEEIKQLNDIVGIEGNYVQRPPYYWDTHGKSNLDGDRGTIPQLGTAEDYSFTSFDNEIDWYLSSSNYIDVVSRNGYKITLKNLSTGIDGWRFQNSTVKRFILNDIPFKIKSNKTIRVYWDMHYNAISSTELRQKVVSVTTINPNEDTLINLRHLTEEELTELNVNKSTMYYLLWFDVSTLAVNEEVTIEMLPVEGGRNLWLNNYGFAYDKMSGYEGYSFKSFNDSQSWNIRGDSTGVEIISRNGYSMTVKKLVQNLDWQISNNEYRYPTILDKEVPFKCKSNKNVGLIWQLKYKTEGATSDTTVTLINQQLTPNVPLEISLPYKTQDELTELGAVSTSVYYLLYFSNTLLEIGEEYTVEMLPLYPNGLVYDGVDDYSENISIPAFTDYTYIFKRTLLNKKYNSASVFKGSNQQSGGGAFICDYNSVEPELMIQGYSFGAGLYANSLNTNDIVYGTKNSVNGQTITSGNNADTEGLTIGKWRAYKQMVFYKLMLYPRTTDMLTINMIKNMMAEDGIIDIQGKLFTDKFTGDFNLDFNKDFLIGN